MDSTLPSLFVSKKEKNELWHKQYVQAITAKSILSGYNERHALMNECVNFYLGLQAGDEFEFLQKAEDGEVLPAKWMDFNKIAVKIDLLIGELSQRGYKINVKAYNKDAQSRKLNEKNRLLTEMRFQPIAEFLEDQVGLPLQQDTGFVPQSQEELDIYMDKSYKETSEIVMRAILNYLRRTQGWDYTRLSLFRDLNIMGACFARNEIIDGMPVLTRVDPRFVIFDTSAKDDYLSDATYWGEICYMSLGEVSKKYKISEQELKESYEQYNKFLADGKQFAALAIDYGFIDQNSRMRIFKTEGGDLRVLVVKAFWQDYKLVSGKDYKDSHGNTHTDVSFGSGKKIDSESVGDNVKNKVVSIWRQGTLIGGKFLKEWGEMKNQTRSADVDRMGITSPPYVALIPNYFNGAIVSKVHRLKPLQGLKNIAMYNLQLAMSRSGTKGIIFDIAQIPKGWDFHTALKYMKVAGVLPIDSSSDGAGQYNQWKDYDMTMSDSVVRFIEISMMLDREMDSISGINEARQGLIQGSSQAVGVTNSALLQSNLSTAMYFDLFSKFFSKNMQIQAGLAKIAWAGKERFAPIIGDVGVNFLEIDIDLDLDDYNVFVDDTPPALADQQIFFQLVMTALQSRAISLSAAVKLFMEKDMDEAVALLDSELAKGEQMQAMQQEQLMQQEQMALQAQQQQAAAANQAKLQAQQMSSQADLQKIVAQGRLDLQQGLTAFKGDMALKRMDMEIAKQKSKEKAKNTKK